MSSFFSNLFRPSNAGTWFFFLLNLIFLATVFGTGRSVEGFLFLLVLYLLSLALSFSSLGQWMLCLVNGARRMARIDMRNKALPLVEEIYRAAKRQTPTLPNRINVRIMYDPTPNAFAIGTNTICLTEGLLDMPDDLIAGVIAHEMGHLALQHTIVQILIGGGNLIISIIMLILEAIRASLSVGTAAGSIRGGGIFHWFGIMMMAFCSGMISCGPNSVCCCSAAPAAPTNTRRMPMRTRLATATSWQKLWTGSPWELPKHPCFEF